MAFREAAQPADGCHDGMGSLLERGRERVSDKPILGVSGGLFDEAHTVGVVSGLGIGRPSAGPGRRLAGGPDDS